jgi:D-alanine-D-alanine ligase
MRILYIAIVTVVLQICTKIRTIDFHIFQTILIPMTHIAILYGGTSSEREVSLRSGKHMQTWCKLAGYSTQLYDLPTDLDTFLREYREYSCIIPVFHGKYGEDGQITAFLQTLGCHVAYSPFEVHTLCIDKYLTNITLAPIGIHIPASHLLKKSDKNKDCTIPYPRIIKPNTG